MNDLKFFSDLAIRIMKILDISFDGEKHYLNNEILFNAYCKGKDLEPIAMTKSDVIIILNDCKRELSKDLKTYSSVINGIDDVLTYLNK